MGLQGDIDLIKSVMQDEAQKLITHQSEILNKALANQVEQIIDDAGLHLVVKLPAHTDDVEVANRCHSEGVSVKPLSRYYIGATDVRGLVVGFAYVDASDLVTCGQRLGQVLKEYL